MRGQLSQPIKCQCCPHRKTYQLICYANQLIGFCVRETWVFNGLIFSFGTGLVTQLNESALGILQYYCITKRSRELSIGNSRFLMQNSPMTHVRVTSFHVQKDFKTKKEIFRRLFVWSSTLKARYSKSSSVFFIKQGG